MGNKRFKELIKKTYGAGSGLNFRFAMMFATILFLSAILMYLFVDVQTIDSGMSMTMNKVFVYWLEAFFASFGLFCAGLCLFCKPVGGKDRWKIFKLLFFFCTFVAVIVLLLPFIIIFFVVNKGAKLLNLKSLGERTIDSIVSLLWWMASFVISVTILLLVCVNFLSCLNTHYQFLGETFDIKPIICYVMLCSILISNKVATIVFFKTTKIENEKEKVIVHSEMALLWNVTILIFSLLLKPLNIEDDALKALVDGLFYSSTVISLLSKVLDSRKKLGNSKEKTENEKSEENIEGEETENYFDEHKEFNKKYWNYYMGLERELQDILDYVALSRNNMDTSSNRINSLLLSVGAEVDFMCKMVCRYEPDSRKNISDYARVLLKKIPDVQNIEITIVDSDLSLHPFKTWDKKHAKDLFWWDAYTSIKHNRIGNSEKGNFKNLLNAMGALYYLEMYYIKKLADEKKDESIIDLPVSRSEVFKICNWVTRYTCIANNTYIDYDPEL